MLTRLSFFFSSSFKSHNGNLLIKIVKFHIPDCLCVILLDFVIIFFSRFRLLSFIGNWSKYQAVPIKDWKCNDTKTYLYIFHRKRKRGSNDLALVYQWHSLPLIPVNSWLLLPIDTDEKSQDERKKGEKRRRRRRWRRTKYERKTEARAKERERISGIKTHS